MITCRERSLGTYSGDDHGDEMHLPIRSYFAMNETEPCMSWSVRIYLIIFALLAVCAMCGYAAAGDPSTRVEPATPEEDDADNWIFGSGPYSDDPKTGKRVKQYAKEPASYRTQPSRYSSEPRYYGGDPFFADNRDTFFQDTPNPFFADVNPMTPLSPIYSNETYGSNTDYNGYGLPLPDRDR